MERSRIENNLLILRYCIERLFKMKIKTSNNINRFLGKTHDIDKRQTLIEFVKDNEVNLNCISFIVRIFGE